MLKQVLDKGRAMELSERQAGIIERGETSVNRVQTKYTSKPKQQPWKGKEKLKGQPQTCGRCGNTHGSDINMDKHVRHVRKLTTTRNTARHHPKTRKLRRSHQDGGGEGTRGLTRKMKPRRRIRRKTTST